MEKEIIKTVRYFAHFGYAPSLDEIHTFLTTKTTKEKLLTVINNISLYTLGEYSIYNIKNYQIRRAISQKKIKIISHYIKILSLFPQIKLVGLSGSMAMMNAKKTDDIDLFIICASNRLWTGRLIAVAIAWLLRLKRKRKASRATDKVCLNLFFQENCLRVPTYKQTEYVGHEILQMKPLFNKDQVYERFLRANKWVFRLFPNAKEVSILRLSLRPSALRQSLRLEEMMVSKVEPSSIRISKKNNWVGNILNILENVLKALQLNIIKQHQTNEIITNSQLWFFPEDFEKKIMTG